MQTPHLFLPANAKLSFLGAGLSLGQSLSGVSLAPNALRNAGVETAIQNLGFNFCDEGDLNFSLVHSEESTQSGCIKNEIENGNACYLIAEKVQKIAAQKHFCLNIGGDHSIAIGTICGLLRQWPNLSVIWVDAHADFNSPNTSPSGNLHGMPLAALTAAFSLNEFDSFKWFDQTISPSRVALIGVRSIDDGEKELLRQSGMRVFTMSEVDRFGIGKVMEMALKAVNPDGDRPLHLSYDIDALDPSIAPSTGTRVRGGLNYREAHYIAEAVAETRCLVSMDMVEINPSISESSEGKIKLNAQNNETVELALEILESALGKRILDLGLNLETA